GALDADAGRDASAWQDALADYFEEYDRIGSGATARGTALFRVEVDAEVHAQERRWLVRQTFDDPGDDRDWGISAIVDLTASDEAGEAIIQITAVGPA
ncbi:MAG: DUF3516 domain-containing protein, partial [Jatrophihabitans sp.]